MAGYIPAFWLSRYKTAVLTLRLSSEERDMSDAPERIWHTTDRKGKIYGATDAHVEPCKSVARHYVEYIRADLVHADAELAKMHHAQAFGAGVDCSAPKVKPLVWEEEDGRSTCLDSEGCDKLYRVLVRHDGKAVLRHNASSFQEFGYNSADEAKAAAQADYERRILSALE